MIPTKEHPLLILLSPHYYSPPEDAHRDAMAYELQYQRERAPNDVEFFPLDAPRDALLSRGRSFLLTKSIEDFQDAQKESGDKYCGAVDIWLDHDIAGWLPGELAELARQCAQVESTVGCPFPFRGANMRGSGYPLRGLGGKAVTMHPGRDEMLEVEFVSGGCVAFWIPQMLALREAAAKLPTPEERVKAALEKDPEGLDGDQVVQLVKDAIRDELLHVPDCAGNGDEHFYAFCWPVPTPYKPPREDGRLNYQSEDWIVQDRARQLLGAKSWLWTKPLLRHIGKYSFGGADANAQPCTNDQWEAAARADAKRHEALTKGHARLLELAKAPRSATPAEMDEVLAALKTGMRGGGEEAEP
jgi:hypothetical protein